MMRLYLFIILISCVITTGCGSNDAAPEVSAAAKQITAIRWIDSSKVYGNINEGQKLAVSFRFKNTGNKPLIIESVKPSCGCTIANFPREPLAPGTEGEITGEFNSEGREGLQHKELTVTSNTSPLQHSVYFEVNVVKDHKTNNN
jgi:uncharacterized protein DUF1573